MGDVDLSVDGLAEIQTGLTAAVKDLGKEQRRANKEVAEQVAAWSRREASSGTRSQRRFASAIVGRSTQRLARVAVVARGSNQGASTAFFGARPLTRYGWNAGRRRGPTQRPQFLPWVGNTWIPGRPGEGPYAIRDALVKHADEIDELILDAPARALEQAFPKGGSR